MVLLLSVLVEPLVEIANVMREKIILGTALTNACRAAKDRSLEYEKWRQLDAEINQDTFKDYFSDAFEDAMNVTRNPTSGSIMTFQSNDGKYNTISVKLDFTIKTEEGRSISEVNARAESLYKFKTKYLKLAESAGVDGYHLTGERMLLISIRN